MQLFTQLVQGLAAFQPLTFFPTNNENSLLPTTEATGSSVLYRSAAILDITQTVSLFAVLLDDHAYNDLYRVFTDNATADFNATGIPVCHGLPAIIARLEDLKDAPSMMAISTQYVDLHTPPVTARAISYVTGNMFTPGWTEPSFTEYGKYVLIPVFILLNFTFRLERYNKLCYYQVHYRLCSDRWRLARGKASGTWMGKFLIFDNNLRASSHEACLIL